MSGPRILFLDIETSPNLVFCWSLFKQNISLNQIVTPAALLCWSAKWQGGQMAFDSVQHGNPERMVRAIHKLLDEADIVIHYNGTSFDIPRLNQEFKKIGLAPPAPYFQIDLYRVVRKKFDLTSSKLEFVAKYFKLGKKVKHPGMELWTGCLNGDKKSWRLMEKYNKQDVILTEKLYACLLPWIDKHPHRSLYAEKVDQRPSCPICKKGRLNIRGWTTTLTRRYRNYQCQNLGCRRWVCDTKGSIGVTVKGTS